MPKSLYGSINLTHLLELYKMKHSAFYKAENGNIYVNVDVYIKDEPDRFKHNASVSIYPSKDAKEKGETRAFIGNLKWSTKSQITGDELDLPPAPNAPFTDGDSHASTTKDETPF